MIRLRSDKDVTIHGPNFALPVLWVEMMPSERRMEFGMASENMAGIGALFFDAMPIEVHWTDDGGERRSQTASVIGGTIKSSGKRGLIMDTHTIELKEV